MQCQQVRDHFADYVIDSLQEPLRLQVTQHLNVCESCRTEAEELKSLWTNLGSIPSAQPGPEARARFDVMLEAYKHGLNNAPSRSWWHRLNHWIAVWWPRQPALQFGAALAFLLLGVLAGHRFQSGPPSAQQPSNEINELRGELAQMRQMVTLSLMQQQSASERLKGVSWSYQMQKPDREVLTALLDTLTHDPNVNVRLATVDALRQFGDQSVVRRGVVEAMTRQDSPMVQIALIDLAVDLHQKESLGTLRQLSQDQNVNETVRERAQKGISELE